MTISTEDLNTRLPKSDPVLLGILQKQADHWVKLLNSEHDLVRNAKFLVMKDLSHPKLCAAHIAAQLGMSARSLHRLLRLRDSSYRLLHEEVVLEKSKRDLLQSDDAITSIAFRVGYSEPSAFARAFKRAEGVSPLEYRKLARSTKSSTAI